MVQWETEGTPGPAGDAVQPGQGELSTHCPFLPRRDLDLPTAVPSLLSSPEKSFEQNTAHSGNSPGPVARRPAEPTASTTVLFCSSALCKSVKGAQGREATPHTKMTRIIHFMLHRALLPASFFPPGISEDPCKCKEPWAPGLRLSGMPRGHPR